MPRARSFINAPRAHQRLKGAEGTRITNPYCFRLRSEVWPDPIEAKNGIHSNGELIPSHQLMSLQIAGETLCQGFSVGSSATATFQYISGATRLQNLADLFPR